MQDNLKYPDLENCGIIGDLHTAAVIDCNGAVQWCCAPFFDSPSIFGALLDSTSGGHFAIRPRRYQKSSSAYLPGTNILQTSFSGSAGELVLTDFMPILQPDGSKPNPEQVLLCRQIECRSGTDVEVDLYFDPRPNYARELPTLRLDDFGAQCGQSGMWLKSDTRLLWEAGCRRARLRLSHGDVAHVVFCWGGNPRLGRIDHWFNQKLRATREFWESWIAQIHYRGRWRALVERSALTLKLLTFQPTGAIVAAPTTSLPERIGGPRNWDYRFSWPRDSAMTLNALFLLGFREEANAYVRWLAGKCGKGRDAVKVLYPIGPEDTSREETLDHLEGYRNSAPVRVGNAASEQRQLDVCGEILETLYLHVVHGAQIDSLLWSSVVNLAEEICANWQMPDDGIWEVRNGPVQFTHSKLLCWAGLDRATRLAEEQGADGYRVRWQSVRDEVAQYILGHCVDPIGGYLTRSAGAKETDASTLVACGSGLLPSDHPILQRTVKAVREQLCENGLVYRYRSNDGLSGSEGTFNLCTFWLIDALATCGQQEEAMRHFNQILRAATPLGLYAEQTDARSLAALGNFPQALTHVGLIHAALTLNSIEEQGVALTGTEHYKRRTPTDLGPEDESPAEQRDTPGAPAC